MKRFSLGSALELYGGTNELTFFSPSVVPKLVARSSSFEVLASTGPGYARFTFLLGLHTSRRQLIAEVTELRSHDVELFVFVPRRSQILKGLLCKPRVEGNISRGGQTDSHTPPAGWSSDRHPKKSCREKSTNPAGTSLGLPAADYNSQYYSNFLIVPQHNITMCKNMLHNLEYDGHSTNPCRLLIMY